MVEDSINHEYITAYIREKLPKQDALLEEISRMSDCEETYAPIIQPEVGQLLSVLMDLHKPKRILEIGTAIGYSAIYMSRHLPPDGHILTIERYHKMVELASANIAKAGLQDTIQIMEGDAAELLPQLNCEFDMVFLDAGKGQYPQFLPDCIRLLRDGGLLFTDNVLYQGMIADESKVIRRKITIVQRLRKYLDMISRHPLLNTSIIPIGDGVAISYVRSHSYE